jgi:hypothetical protein
MTASAILETLRQYGEAFSGGDSARAARYYDEPATIVTGNRILPLSTRRDAEEVFARMLTDLRARQFARAEYQELHARALSDALAIASGVAVRYRVDGSELVSGPRS